MLVVPAYAKLNLALEVVRRRADGWHEIASVVVIIDWHDLVGLSVAHPAGGGTAVSLRLDGPEAPAVPDGGDNLAKRAAAALLALTGRDDHTLDIWLDKRIPAQAGLGGGSADAAAVLRTGAALPGLQPRGGAGALASAAQALGSDVPAVLTGGAVFVAGRGEHIEPLPAPALHLAVAIAGRASTASVYAASDPAEHGDEGRARRVAEALRTGRALDDSDLGSALEPAARRTAVGLAERLDALRAATPTHHWHLTGSGGAAFALAADRQSAQRLAAAARGTGLPARACRTVTPTYNPGT